MYITTVRTRGRIAIPAPVRAHYRIRPGTRLLIAERGAEVVLTPVDRKHFLGIAGVLRTRGRLARRLLESRAGDRARE